MRQIRDVTNRTKRLKIFVKKDIVFCIGFLFCVKPAM